MLESSNGNHCQKKCITSSSSTSADFVPKRGDISPSLNVQFFIVQMLMLFKKNSKIFSQLAAMLSATLAQTEISPQLLHGLS